MLLIGISMELESENEKKLFKADPLRGDRKIKHFACGRRFHLHKNLRIKHLLNYSNPSQ